MTFTFGICTDWSNKHRVVEIINSIRNLQIPECEIIVSDKDGWITEKKNRIAKVAKHENLVLLHDYFIFHQDWYRAYEDFGQPWDVCSNPQLLHNGNRHFTDWVNWDDPHYPRYYSFDYNDWTHTKYQYVSGGYFLVKRDFLRENPLNESMLQGSPEDVEWSLRIRDKATIKCNPNAVVQHNKIHRDCH